MLPTRRFRISRALAMLAIACVTPPLISCATPTTQAEQSAGLVEAAPAQPAAAAVPCLVLTKVIYHAPKTQPEANEWLAGNLQDPLNHYDTPSTVSQIRKINAKISALCPPTGGTQ